ncbi:MAG: TrmH family RNA methyltransferase [Nostocoides sp.]
MRAPVLSNPRSDRVKAVRALSRRTTRTKTGRFVADGPQSVREAVAYAADRIIDLYVTADAGERHADIVAGADEAGVYVHRVTPEVLGAMSETDSPQGLLAVCQDHHIELSDILDRRPRLLVLLNEIRDPGNLGTVIRGADAAGADAVLVTESSVDVNSPKAVRSTAGSLFHLPVLTGLSGRDVVAQLKAHQIRVLAADGGGSTPLPQADLSTPHAWLVGNEAWGLPPELRNLADDVVQVPIYGKAESLNLAMAATICLYASAGVLRTGQ